MKDDIINMSTGQDIGVWVSHPCPYCPDARGRPILNLKRDLDRVVSHCFSTSCEMHGHKSWYISNINPEQVKAMLNHVDKVNKDRTYPLPERFTYDIPDKYFQYLDRYGINSELIREYRIGYCDVHVYNDKTIFEDRLIIPTPSGYMARSLDEQPKWKNFTGYNFTSTSHLRDNTGPCVVLCEDPISCITLGRVMPSIALLGTSIKEPIFHECMKYRKVFIWLDNDSAGIKGAMQCKKALDPYVQTRIVTAGQDPKCYNTYMTKQIIKASDFSDKELELMDLFIT